MPKREDIRYATPCSLALGVEGDSGYQRWQVSVGWEPTGSLLLALFAFVDARRY